MMIFCAENNQVVPFSSDDPLQIPANAIWIDLLNPTREEEKAVEQFISIEIPTREEMLEIEVSNRLYSDKGAHYMTATMMTKVDSGAPETHAVTFMLTDTMLVSIRYTDATSFRTFKANTAKLSAGQHDGMSMFLGLMESIINRIADILERLDRDIDRITKDIFSNPEVPEQKKSVNYHCVLDRIGRCGNLSSKIHQSLVTFGRVIAYATHHKEAGRPENQLKFDDIRKDIMGLSDHGTYLTGRVNFLLDATLGMISIEQNSVFRVLSIASLVFLPPTLVAGIYGMNFEYIPELKWMYGYPLAILFMLVAAILPYLYLKKRGVL